MSGQCVYKCGPSYLKSTVVASNHVLPYLFCFHSTNFNWRRPPFSTNRGDRENCCSYGCMCMYVCTCTLRARVVQPANSRSSASTRSQALTLILIYYIDDHFRLEMVVNIEIPILYGSWFACSCVYKTFFTHLYYHQANFTCYKGCKWNNYDPFTIYNLLCCLSFHAFHVLIILCYPSSNH